MRQFKFRFNMKKIVIVLLLFSSNYIFSQNEYDFSSLIDVIRNAKIIAQDDENTYLGNLANEFNSESIFNEFGTYGNEFSTQSIWNEFSTFGNEFNVYSPFNKFATQPPMLIKKGKIVGFLTTNKSIRNGISPNLLKALKEEF